MTEAKPLPKKLLDSIEREVMAGLPREQDRRAEALRSLAYYNRQGAHLIPRRDAESYSDYMARPKRHLPFLARVIRVLTSKLYAPGPTRDIHESKPATEWLSEAYQDSLINSLWQRADRYSHLFGLSAFQVGATGDPDHPLKFTLWGGWVEIVPYCDPDDCNTVVACVTIDAYDESTRYTLWTPTEYRVYRTDKLQPGQTAKGRTAKHYPAESGRHEYGVLPFAFVWFELPTSGIYTVCGLGGFLSDLNASIDIEMSDMAGAVTAYHTPLPVAYDCDVALQPVVGMGKFIRVNAVPTDLEHAPTPRLEYLQAELDITGGWDNIKSVIEAELEALGIPMTSWRMDSATLPSGAAIVAEQAPLVEYATERREPFRKYEDDLKSVSCAVGGSYYSRPDLTAAVKLPMTLTWPAPAIDLPGADRDAADQASLELGLESRVMICMRRFGMTRPQAIEHLKLAIEDEQDMAEMRAELDAIEAEKAATAAKAAAGAGPDDPFPVGGPDDGQAPE